MQVYKVPSQIRKVMTIIANILVQRFNKITLLNLWRNTPQQDEQQVAIPIKWKK